ncbi:hypothetical protein Q7P37_002812 [Cladosporium fusiforme]
MEGASRKTEWRMEWKRDGMAVSCTSRVVFVHTTQGLHPKTGAKTTACHPASQLNTAVQRAPKYTSSARHARDTSPVRPPPAPQHPRNRASVSLPEPVLHSPGEWERCRCVNRPWPSHPARLSAPVAMRPSTPVNPPTPSCIPPPGAYHPAPAVLHIQASPAPSYTPSGGR